MDFCCCGVFAENKKLGQSIVASLQHAETNKGAMADIHLESASLYLAEVKQDSYDPLRVGRFVLSKWNHFPSTAESLQCHAYTMCLLVPVSPKGCTIDQVCAPIDAYKDFNASCTATQPGSYRLRTLESLC